MYSFTSCSYRAVIVRDIDCPCSDWFVLVLIRIWVDLSGLELKFRSEKTLFILEILEIEIYVEIKLDNTCQPTMYRLMSIFFSNLARAILMCLILPYVNFYFACLIYVTLVYIYFCMLTTCHSNLLPPLTFNRYIFKTQIFINNRYISYWHELCQNSTSNKEF